MDGPSPLPTSDWQRSRFEYVTKQASADSQAASPLLLAALDEQRFRARLIACCPDLANASSIELLQHLRDQHRSAEIASGFDAESPTGGGRSMGWWGMTLADGVSGSELLNQWEVRVRHNGSFASGGWFDIQDDVETKLYGLRPFSRRGHPMNHTEAAERGIYALLNVANSDLGSPLYGDVTAVLSPRHVRGVALLSAIDTGEWTGFCNSTGDATRLEMLRSTALQSTPRRTRPSSTFNVYPHNCSAYKFRLGTFSHMDHLLLANLRYWKLPLPDTLARRFETTRSDAPVDVDPVDLYSYIEVMPAASLRLPEAIHFLIGSFPALFGSPLGAKLQQWCVTRGWQLLWALGSNFGFEYELDFFSIPLNGSFPNHARLLDPTVLEHTPISNMSVSAATVQLFGAGWARATQLRLTAHPESNVSNITWAKLWRHVSSELPEVLRVGSVRAGACADPDRCIAISVNGHCVCVDKPQDEPGLASGKFPESSQTLPESSKKVPESDVAAPQRLHLPNHTVSGFSSGGDMAVIHLVAFSSATRGATIVGGAPYGCNRLPDSEWVTCQFPDKDTDWPKYQTIMNRYIRQRAAAGHIDPIEFLHQTPVVLFSSHNDTVVYQAVMRAVEQQLAPLVGGHMIKRVFNVPCGHAWPTDNPKMDRFDHEDVPFINDCNYDLSGESLRHMLNRTLQPRRTASHRLHNISQTRFIPNGSVTVHGVEMTARNASQLDDTALLFVPTACGVSDTAACGIHVHYHGCELEYPEWSATHLGLHEWAEANQLLVLHPRVRWTTYPDENYRCWDWEGDTGLDFDTHDGLQLRTVANMIESLSRLHPGAFVREFGS